MKNGYLVTLTFFIAKYSAMPWVCNDAKCFKIKSCLHKTTTVLVLNAQLYEAISIFHFGRTVFYTVNLIVMMYL